MRKEDIAVKYEILDMSRYNENEHAVDVALPVLAIECEATPLLENSLDPYENAVIKLISLGLSLNGIAKALNTSESLTEVILFNLESKEYVYKEIGRPWKLTEAGNKYIEGITYERTSSEAVYGYMFVNAIKKSVMPYFYEGNLVRVSLFRGEKLPYKLTIKEDERLTFGKADIRQQELRNAYRAYYRNIDTSKAVDNGEITRDEAIDLFADLESFEEEIESEDNIVQDNNGGELEKDMYIRALDKDPEMKYLRMRIIIDPSYPGGYRVESPFDIGGIDNEYFLRQIRWLENKDDVYLDDEILADFLNKEISVLSPSYKISEKDFQSFIIERMPLLKIHRTQIPYIYEDMGKIYGLMQRQDSLIEKDNIVSDLARSVVEALFNQYFRQIGKEKLIKIKKRALNESKGNKGFKENICRNVRLDSKNIAWVNVPIVIGKLDKTYGHSIMEKFINMLVVDYYIEDERMHGFLTQSDINSKYQLIDKMNKIRRKVSHDTDERFSKEDYQFYISNVFKLINELLASLWED